MAVLSRFLNTEVGEIRIFSRDEKKQEDIRLSLQNDKLKFYIGDVRLYDSIDAAMRGVDYVFHAAALKQVPSCEFYPMEAVRTNILGAENVIRAAVANKVQKVIVLSTDKAVYPTNAMGLSKALMEKIMLANARALEENQTVLCATRYGNVMGSRGSVIPLFINQIRTNQQFSITDPSMTRFLMSLEESVELVLYAYEHGKQGDIFAQKGPACTIQDLCIALKELFKAPNETRIIGTRHGEKLYETLVSREEMARVSDLGRYFRIPADNRDLNYNKYFVEGEERISNVQDYTSHNTERLDAEGVKKILLRLDFIQEALAQAKSS